MSVSFGSGDYYNYNNNNQVNVPYRPQEQQPQEEDVVIPYRREDDAPEENTDTYTSSIRHGAGADVSYDTVESLSVSIQPYIFHYDAHNDDGQDVSIMAGPEISVSGLTSQCLDGSENPLDNLPENGATCSNADMKLNVSVSKDLETVDNTALFADFETALGYKHIAPFKQSKNHVSMPNVSPVGNAFDYSANIRAGLTYSMDDKNKFSFYAHAGVDGYTGKMTQGDPSDAGTVNVDGEPQYIETQVNNNVMSAGLGAEYTRITKNGQFSVSADGGFGLRTTESRNLTVSPSKTNGATVPGTFGKVTVSFKF